MQCRDAAQWWGQMTPSEGVSTLTEGFFEIGKSSARLSWLGAEPRRMFPQLESKLGNRLNRFGRLLDVPTER
jgi:hypothetical protein